VKKPKTLGGTQFWADRVVVDDHRLQEHVRFGRARVLDGADRRLHTGRSLDDARRAFDDAVARPRQRGDHLVFFLHGYGGKTRRMFKLRDAAREAGFTAEVVQYPSLFRTIEELAASISDLVVESAAAHGRIKKVSLVAFSMGGLVASLVAHRLVQRRDAPSLARLITIGTPHGGSPLADVTKWLTSLGGPNIAELTTASRRAMRHLPEAKAARIGVVGSGGFRNGWTLLGLIGEGDGIVELSSAVDVPNAARFVVEGVRHTELPSDPAVIDAVTTFLDAGQFSSTRRS
jgi:pimeloyl-ACP methyl ester carboxylesterase